MDADARYVVVTMPTGFRDRLVSVRVDTGALAAAYPTEELKSLHVGLASRDDAADGTATEDGQVQQDAASVRDYIATLVESDD